MANYKENFASKLDWAMPFQRTGAFPLDRSNLFETLADAQLYAQGGADKRGLGGTSYVGQIIVVYENDVVTAYIINADRSLKAMASTASDGSSVQSVLDALNEHKKAYDVKVKELEDADTAITERLDIIEGEGEGSIKKALADAKADATTKDNDLHTAISAEIDADVKVVSDALSGEITRAKAAEKANTDAIATEKTRAEGEEERIEGLITTEATAREEADTALGNRIAKFETGGENSVSQLKQDLAGEVSRAKAAEEVLTNNLAAEVTRAKAAEKENKDAITVLNGADTVEGSVDKKIADNNIFDTDILTVNALGGIKAGENLNGLTIEEVLKKLLYPYVAHLVSASSSPKNGGVFECGDSQTVTTITADITKKSEPITKVEFVDGSTVLATKTDGIAAGGLVTHSCSIPVSTNKSFTVKVTDKAGTVVTATTGGFNFVYPYYWGVCVNDAAIDEAMVKGLTKKVETKGSKGVTYTADFQRAVIAYPASYGDIRKILDPNSFDVTATFTKHSVNVTGLDGKSVSYNVYVNGAFTATNFKFTFSY